MKMLLLQHAESFAVLRGAGVCDCRRRSRASAWAGLCVRGRVDGFWGACVCVCVCVGAQSASVAMAIPLSPNLRSCLWTLWICLCRIYFPRDDSFVFRLFLFPPPPPKTNLSRSLAGRRTCTTPHVKILKQNAADHVGRVGRGVVFPGRTKFPFIIHHEGNCLLWMQVSQQCRR